MHISHPLHPRLSIQIRPSRVIAFGACRQASLTIHESNTMFLIRGPRIISASPDTFALIAAIAYLYSRDFSSDVGGPQFPVTNCLLFMQCVRAAHCLRSPQAFWSSTCTTLTAGHFDFEIPGRISSILDRERTGASTPYLTRNVRRKGDLHKGILYFI